MSRRAGADTALKNQNIIKALLKLEPNKTCADCKRNKHPRWASWNLGVFVCIRCSGIHRGMGTHISRVKSVDLDAWTDEQLQSILKWGNARANKYWEAKLAPGHVPSEAKIENFIRTKYESKRWVMDGPMPDPSTLDVEGDDDIPLNIVQQKAKLERSSSQRISSAPSQPIVPPRRRPQQNIDLFGDDTPSPPVRPRTTDVPGPRAPPTEPPPPPKQTKPADSLLGLDFFSTPQPAAYPPTSAKVNSLGTTGQSRPDLKQSILSLYASKPPPPQSPTHARSPSFGAMSSPPAAQSTQQNSFGGLNDAFSGLSFTSSPAPQQAKPPPFADLSSFSSTKKSPPAPAQVSYSPPPLSGGGFFDPPSQQTAPKPTPVSKPSNGLTSLLVNKLSTNKPTPPVPTSTSITTSNDLFGLDPSPGPAPPPPPPPSKATSSPLPSPIPSINSVFNLSSPVFSPTAAPKPTPAPKTSTQLPTMFSSNIDAWGSTDAWSTPDVPSQPATKPRAPTITSPTITTSTSTSKPTRTSFGQNDFGGWGAPIQPPLNTSTSTKPPATVSADEDFGGWNSAGPITPGTGLGGFGGGGGFGDMSQHTTSSSTQPQLQPQTSKPTFGGGGDDLFSNVWE